MISILDYGAGNLRSISNALKKIGAEVAISSGITKEADALILPGVGNFGHAMEKLTPLRHDIFDHIDSGRPFLGLCLGLQVLFESSDEAPGVRGLRLLKGRCTRFRGGKVPHMGWNQVSLVPAACSPIFDGIEDKENFYFVHSYYAPVMDRTVGICNYGVDFSAAVQRGNVFACQFHPERSGEAGLMVLENFIREVKK